MCGWCLWAFQATDVELGNGRAKFGCDAGVAQPQSAAENSKGTTHAKRLRIAADPGKAVKQTRSAKGTDTPFILNKCLKLSRDSYLSTLVVPPGKQGGGQIERHAHEHAANEAFRRSLLRELSQPAESRGYFNDVLIDANLVLRREPIPFMTEMIASEMPAAMRPYSMAVAAVSSARNLRMMFIPCDAAKNLRGH
jgi:hypothetical protein